MPASGSTPAVDPYATLPKTCNILNWTVFTSGPHKDGKDYYSPEMVDRIAANFKLLQELGHTTPRAKIAGEQPEAKIGHDVKQVLANRLKGSMGFLSVGQITRCDVVLGHPGTIEIDVRNVPTKAVGAKIESGQLNSGSVELLPSVLDPRDPGKRIQGPILTAISLLGEELPAVRNFDPKLQARSKPRATFDDGSFVPADHDISDEWTDAMAEANRVLMSEMTGKHSVNFGGREYSDGVTICFSEMSPITTGFSTMTPLTPDQIAALKAAGVADEILATIGSAPPAPDAMAMPAGGAAGGAPNPPLPGGSVNGMSDDADSPEDKQFAAKMSAYAADPAATEDQKMMAAMYASSCKKMSAMSAKFADDASKRIGAVEAKMAADAAKADETKMAAFSDRAEERITKLLISGKLDKATADKVVRQRVKDIAAVKTFANETDRFATLETFLSPYEASPVSKQLVEANAGIANGKQPKGNQPMTEGLATLIGPGSFLDRQLGTKDMRTRLGVN